MTTQSLPTVTQWNQMQLIQAGEIALPKTLAGKSRTEILTTLHKLYKITDKGKGKNATTRAFHAVWDAANKQPHWKNGFSVACAPEYHEAVCAAIIFYHGENPVEHDHLIISEGYAAW